jgi:hypothetical protein
MLAKRHTLPYYREKIVADSAKPVRCVKRTNPGASAGDKD